MARPPDRPRGRGGPRVLLCAVAVLAAGCAPSEAERNAPADTRATATAAVDPAAAAAVVATYDRVRAVQSDVLAGERSAEDAEAELAPLVDAPLLESMLEQFAYYEGEGVVHKGSAVSDPEVTAMAGDPPTATLVDCWDTTGVDVVDERTGASAKDPNRPGRVPVTVRAERGPAGGWVITELTMDFGRPC
jgi:inosine-uridine nucleoside N-ribohydrolase